MLLYRLELHVHGFTFLSFLFLHFKALCKCHDYILKMMHSMLTHLLDYIMGEDSGGKGSTEDVGELLVEASDAHPLKVPVWTDDGLARLSGLCFTWRGETKSEPTCITQKESQSTQSSFDLFRLLHELPSRS